MTLAAVLRDFGRPLQIEELDLAAPKEGEVRVELKASGVCHTDRTMQLGAYPFSLPLVLGHEGCGVVSELGAGVSGVGIGDHVVLAWVPQCGVCYMCTRGQPEFCESGLPHMTDGTLLDGTMRFRSGSTDVGQAGYLGTFARAVVVPENCVVPIDNDVPFEEGALIGCGVLTGFGAAVNTARLGPGDHVVIAGCGGVGLNAIQGARIAGAEMIIAVDRVSAKLDMARLLGATHTVDTTEIDLPTAVREVTEGRGADVGIEVTGVPAVLADITAATRRGGTIVIVGQQPMDATFPIPTGMMNMLGQRILPSIYGGSDVRRDIPRLIGLMQRGELHLEQMVSRRIKLSDVNEALSSLDEGSAEVRTVIDLSA